MGTTCIIGGLLIIGILAGMALFNVPGKDMPHENVSSGTDATAIPDVAIGTIHVGSDLNLYGRTIDNQNFDWESLRGKFVLVKFTATWCGPCKGEVPGMLDAYKKYHSKGLEIVSVYIWERGADPVKTVKQFVEEEKLPWIIISESLSVKAGQPPQGEAFGIEGVGVPTMLLVDKEGKVFAVNTRGTTLQRELQKLFGG